MGVPQTDDDSSDLAGLWAEALADFERSTGRNLKDWQFRSMDEAMASAQKHQDNFSSFRHDHGKLDYVRSLLGNNLNNIQKVVTTAKMAADAAGAFPPALPATALMTAFTVVFQTFKDVKADYDRVTGFYTQMGSFFDQISMVENKNPKLAPFDRCIRKVFSAMMTIAGIAADYKSKGRFKKWAKNLLDGGADPKLAGAYGTMEDAIVKLHQAVGLATLSLVFDVKETTTRIESKTDRIDGKADNILRLQEETKSITVDVREGVGVLREGQEHMQESMGLEFGSLRRAMTSGLNHAADDIKTEMKNMLGDFLKATNERQSGNTQDKQANDKSKQKGQKDAGSRKQRVVAQVKTHFADSAEALRKIKAQRREIEESFVEGTGQWIFEDATYKQWANGNVSALWISGNAGTGKSYLAHAIVSSLERRRGEKLSVASFFFREDQEDLRSFRNALRCAVVQVAETNHRYAEKVAAEINKPEADDEPWEQFFASRFPADSESHLYLILDGVDEAKPDDRKVIAALIQQLTSAQLNVHVLLTGRTDLAELFSRNGPTTIELSKQAILGDMRTLILARMRSLPRVRKFHRQTRKRIEQRLLESADSMLFIEHMLRRLSAIGREAAVLKDLDKNMPSDLESLYKLLLAECQKGRTPTQYETLRTLLALLAYSQRALTLDEAADLAKITDPDSTFDIEDEVIGRSARLLDVGGDRDDADNDDDSQDARNDDTSEPFVDSGKSAVTIQERSLREYFRAINVEENGLRTPPAHAHLLIFELLVKLLSSGLPTEGETGNRLQEYAAQFWAQHFVEIDVDPEHAPSVITGLITVLNNENNVAACFEQYQAPYYDQLDSNTSLLAKLKVWLDLSKDLDSLPPASKTWVDSLIDTHKQALLPLAKGHIHNQFDRLSTRLVDCIYLFSRSALTTAGVFELSDDETADVFRLFEYFPDTDRGSVNAFRAIAHVLQRRGLYQKSEEMARNALEMEDPHPKTRFSTHWILAFNLWKKGATMNEEAGNETDAGGEASTDPESNQQEGEAAGGEHNATTGGASAQTTAEPNPSANVSPNDHTVGEDESADEQPLPGTALIEEAAKEVEAALAILPEDWKTVKRWCTSVEGILVLKVYCMRDLGRHEDALAAYNERRAVRPDETVMTGVDLNNMLNLIRDSTKEYPPGAYFDILDSWKPQERMKWMQHLVEVDYFGDSEALSLLITLLMAVEEERRAIVVTMIEDYLKTLRKDNWRSAVAKDMLTSYYRRIAKDLETSSRLAFELLDVEYSEDDIDQLEVTLFTARSRLCDQVFQQFRESTSPEEKLELLATMKKIPVIKIGFGYDDQNTNQALEDMNESPILIMQALMTRTIGSPVEFQKLMNEMFKTSLEGLTDTLGFNDSHSLRFLARVLSCIPGLTRDAQIAVSCQYSITDPDVSHDDSDSDSGSEDEVTDGTQAEASTEEATTNGETEATPAKGDEPPTDDAAVKTVSVKTTTVAITQPPGADVVTEITTKVERLDIGDTQAPPDEGEDGDDDRGDLLPDQSYFCNGNCDYSGTDWTAGSLYVCIHCSDCDLCETCYQQRMAWNKGEPVDKEVEPWCGQDHAYIKGPIEGWRGVKDGVIRIQEGDKKLEIPFKEWLRDLREVRWPKAWDNFWRGESFLRSGFEVDFPSAPSVQSADEGAAAQADAGAEAAGADANETTPSEAKIDAPGV